MTRKRNVTDRKKVGLDVAQMKSDLMEQEDFLVPVAPEAVQAILEVEMEECLQKHSRQFNPFGAITGARTAYVEVPVLFVTTGIFELVAENPQMIPNRTRFVIDEAYRVLKQCEYQETVNKAKAMLKAVMAKGFSNPPTSV